jgi:AcrR family transcriptional regulator
MRAQGLALCTRKEPVAEQNEVKERILRAAADLFMERGFAGTSVREIGERAEVGQSSLYHHARSKGQLLRDLHGSFAQELIRLIEQVVASDASPTIQLRGVIDAVMSVVHTHRAEVTVYLRESYALPADARDEVGQERNKIDSMVDLILQRGLDSGEFRQDLDIHLTRLAILGMCNWSYQWYRPNGSQSMADISEYFADLAVRGVLSDRPRRTRKVAR